MKQYNDPLLVSLYKMLNKVLFKDRLPKTVIAYANLNKKLYRGATVFGKTWKPKVIVIDLHDPDPLRVLVHEMAHVYYTTVMGKGRVGPDHPPGFVRVLRSAYKKLGLDLDPQEIGELTEAQKKCPTGEKTNGKSARP